MYYVGCCCGVVGIVIGIAVVGCSGVACYVGVDVHGVVVVVGNYVVVAGVDICVVVVAFADCYVDVVWVDVVGVVDVDTYWC